MGEALCCNGTCPLGVGSVGRCDLSGLWTLQWEMTPALGPDTAHLSPEDFLDLTLVKKSLTLGETPHFWACFLLCKRKRVDCVKRSFIHGFRDPSGSKPVPGSVLRPSLLRGDGYCSG